MSNVAIVYHSGFGHTKALAEAVAKGAEGVAGVSAKMLTERLRTLEGAGLVSRDYEATIPPKVTYALTARGHELDEVMSTLAEIAIRWEAEDKAQRARKPAELRAAE